MPNCNLVWFGDSSVPHAAPGQTHTHVLLTGYCKRCCHPVPCPHVAHIGPVIAKQLQLRVFLQIKVSSSRSKRGRELIGALCVYVCVGCAK